MDQQLEYAIYFVEIIGENTINRVYSVTDRNNGMGDMVIKILLSIISLLVLIGFPPVVYFASGKVVEFLINKKGLSVENKRTLPYGKRAAIVKDEIEIFYYKNIWWRISITLLSIPVAIIVAKLILSYAINR